MIESSVYASEDAGTKKSRPVLRSLQRLAVWFFETLFEALGTLLVLVALYYFWSQKTQPQWQGDLSLKLSAAIVLMVLTEFALTGYLATTAIARVVLHGTRQRVTHTSAPGFTSSTQAFSFKESPIQSPAKMT